MVPPSSAGPPDTMDNNEKTVPTLAGYETPSLSGGSSDDNKKTVPTRIDHRTHSPASLGDTVGYRKKARLEEARVAAEEAHAATMKTHLEKARVLEAQALENARAAKESSAVALQTLIASEGFLTRFLATMRDADDSSVEGNKADEGSEHSKVGKSDNVSYFLSP